MINIFAALVGGLGGNQLLSPEPSIGSLLTSLGVVSYGNWLTDGWKSDPYLTQIKVYPANKVVLVAHSLGCATAIKACNDARFAAAEINIDYLCLIEPVSYGNPLQLPSWIVNYDVLLADALIDFPIRIAGCATTTIKGTSHNSICHAQETLDLLSQRITALSGTGDV